MGLGRKLFLGSLFVGVLFSNRCADITYYESEETVEQGFGNLEGRVVWDLDEDRVYDPVSGASVTLYIPDSQWNEYSTSSNSSGKFYFHEIVAREYLVTANKSTEYVDDYDFPHTVTYSGSKTVEIKDQKTLDMGDLKIGP